MFVNVFAPPIQLVWRPADLTRDAESSLPVLTSDNGTPISNPPSLSDGATTTSRSSSTNSTTTPPTFVPTTGLAPGSIATPTQTLALYSGDSISRGGFSEPQLAGAVVGGVIGTLLCVGLGFFIFTKLRRRQKMNQGAEAAGVVAAGSAPYHQEHGKAELEDSGIAAHDGLRRFELPSPSSPVELEGAWPLPLPEREPDGVIAEDRNVVAVDGPRHGTDRVDGCVEHMTSGTDDLGSAEQN